MIYFRIRTKSGHEAEYPAPAEVASLTAKQMADNLKLGGSDTFQAGLVNYRTDAIEFVEIVERPS